MHYYAFDIGDYRRDTAHLKPMEHYIYRSLIDWYFLDEKPIPKKTQLVMRRLNLDNQPETESMLLAVLEDFFDEMDDGWHQKRIDQTIADYHAKAAINKENGKKGGRPSKKQPNEAQTKPEITQSVNFANPSESELNPNQEPITNNQEPVNKNPPQCVGVDTREKMLVDTFAPNLADVNVRLKSSGHKEIDATLMLKELARFKDEYSKNSIAYPENWYLGRFSSWIMTNHPSRQPGNKSSKNNQPRPSQQPNRNVNDAWPDIPEHAPAVDNTELPEDFV